MGRPVFPADEEKKVFQKICEKCGTPDKREWPEASKFKYYSDFVPEHSMPNRLDEEFRACQCPSAVSLLKQMLSLNPSRRITADNALKHKFFIEEPTPCDPKALNLAALPHSCHELRIKQDREARKKQQEAERQRDAKRKDAAKQQHKPAPRPAQPTRGVHYITHIIQF